MSLSTALRSLLYDYAAGRRPSPQLARTCTRLADEIRRIGINVNQIARSLNAGFVAPDIPSELLHQLRHLRAVLRDLHGQLLIRQLPTKP